MLRLMWLLVWHRMCHSQYSSSLILSLETQNVPSSSLALALAFGIELWRGAGLPVEGYRLDAQLPRIISIDSQSITNRGRIQAQNARSCQALLGIGLGWLDGLLRQSTDHLPSAPRFQSILSLYFSTSRRVAS